MEFAKPLTRGRLVRRYKRFLADVLLDDGREVTAHCANPGAMLGLNAPGSVVWLEPNDDPKRTLRFAWRLVELPGGAWAGIDASLPNRLVKEALATGGVPALAGYAAFRPEVRYGRASRIDFLATGPGLPDAWLEVKNVHLSRSPGLAEPLGALAAAHPEVSIGCYPFNRDGVFGANIVLRSQDEGALAAAEAGLAAMAAALEA